MRFRASRNASKSDPESAFNGRLIESIPDRHKAITATRPTPRRHGLAFRRHGPRILSTTSSSTRPARSPSPTSSPPAPLRRTSCCSATRCSSASRSRACTRAARASQPSTTCWMASPPSRPTAASSSRPPARMHPDVCRFISEAVYDARLHPEPANQRQQLLLDSRAHPALRPTGIVFLPLEHDGNSQRSAEEAEAIRAHLCEPARAALSEQAGRGAPHGRGQHPRRRALQLAGEPAPRPSFRPAPASGRSTSFRGRKPRRCSISMATSSGDYLPRNIEFLYDKNRLNVAISRAKCLAVVVASPALMHIKCGTPEQMALVNTLCWVERYADQAAKTA